MPGIAFIEIGPAHSTLGVITASTNTGWSDPPDNVSRSHPPLMDSTQIYYWTRVWQEGEQETLEELSKNKGKTFASGKEAIAWLLDTSDD